MIHRQNVFRANAIYIEVISVKDTILYLSHPLNMTQIVITNKNLASRLYNTDVGKETFITGKWRYLVLV